MASKLESMLSTEQLERLSVQTGFVRRRSKLGVRDFIKLVLFDHLLQPCSLQQHAASLHQETGYSISKQAIDKRFNEGALLFIQKLFEQLLSEQVNLKALSSELSEEFTSIRIMDSTEFKLPDFFEQEFPGYNQSARSCAAIQFEYDVLSGKVLCLSLTHARMSDKTFADQLVDTIGPGELILRDLGYYSVDSYAKIEEREAFYISRLRSTIGIYTAAGDNQRQDWACLYNRIKHSGKEVLDEWMYIGEGQRHRVRLIAWVLPETEQRRRLEKRKNKKKGRHKKQVTQQDIGYSKLNVFITNISEDRMSAPQLYRLYKLRWQIELLFKTWKSILHIGAVKKMKTCRLKCYLYSKLIWILISRDIMVMVETDSWQSDQRLLSPYKVAALLRSAAIELKQLLFTGRAPLLNWLAKTAHLLNRYGCKDNRKQRVFLHQLLQLKTT